MKTITHTLMALSLLSSSLAIADTPASTNPAKTPIATAPKTSATATANNADLTTAVNNLIAGYGKHIIGTTDHAGPYFTQTPNDKASVMVQNGLGAIASATTNYLDPQVAVAASSNTAGGLLSPSAQAVSQSLSPLTATQKDGLIRQLLCAPTTSASTGGVVIPSSSSCNITTHVPDFDANTLINIASYQTADQASANKYIQYASGLANPMTVLDPNSVDQLKRDPRQYQQYLLSLRGHVAAQSIGLSNLYHIYAERVPAPSFNQLTQDLQGLQELSGKMTINTPLSPLGVEQYSATRRLNPEWHKNMQSALPFELAREQVYLMAEMRYELFKSRLELERLNAAIAVLLLQQMQQMQNPPQQLTNLSNQIIQNSKK